MAKKKKAVAKPAESKPQVVSMTLSLPSDVRERMRNYPGLKWSALMTTAFTQAMNEVEDPAFAIDYLRVTARLLRSRFESEPTAYRHMFYQARNWAADKATYQELSNLAAFRDANRDQFHQLFATDERLHSKVAAAIIGSDDEKAITEFWQRVGGIATNMPKNKNNTLAAFVHGALEAFDRAGV